MQKRIYVLEDDKGIEFILNHILLDQGYQVKVYETVSALREALDAALPDLLLMDVHLPDGNGMELCAELKASEDFLVPILMMSADWLRQNKDSCPADGYMNKPFDLDVLLSRIGTCLQPAS